MNLFGFRCLHCQRPLWLSAHGLCSRCVKMLTAEPYCGGCGMPLVENRLHCGHCLQDEPKWQRLVRVSRYQDPLIGWIHRFKFQQHYWLDRALARLLLLAIKRAQREHGLPLPQVILPVPLFWQRQWQRGFNQSELLARYLAKWLAIPLDNQSLQRIRATRPQRELSGNARKHNLQQAFAYQPLQPYHSVAVVDDVVTTGATLNHICLALKKAGVAHIQVWALARA